MQTHTFLTRLLTIIIRQWERIQVRLKKFPGASLFWCVVSFRRVSARVGRFSLSLGGPMQEEKKISSGVFLAHKCNQAKQVRSVAYCFADLSHEMDCPRPIPTSRERWLPCQEDLSVMLRMIGQVWTIQFSRLVTGYMIKWVLTVNFPGSNFPRWPLYFFFLLLQCVDTGGRGGGRIGKNPGIPAYPVRSSTEYLGHNYIVLHLELGCLPGQVKKLFPGSLLFEIVASVLHNHPNHPSA